MGRVRPTPQAPALPADAPVLHIRTADGSAQASAGPQQPLILIGSRRDCDLTIPHGDIAKTHAAIVHTGPAILVIDLCSRSGTWINNKRVRRGVLTPQAHLRLGPVELTLEFTQPPQQNDPQQALRFGHPLRLEGPNQTIELDVQPVVIGRRSICDVVVDTPDTSLAHALIFEIAGLPVIADLDSRSGTLLDGQPVQLAPLHDGAMLTIGGETLTVRTPEASRATPPTDPQPASAPHSQPAGPTRPAGDPLDDADVERLLAGLEQRIVAIRKQLRVQLNALNERDHALRAREQQLESQQARIEARLRELDARQTELDQRDRELRETAATLQREQKRLASGEKRLQQATRELNEQRRRLEEQHATIQQQAAELDARQQQLEQAAEQIETTQAELARQAAALEARQQALDQRARLLDEQAARLEQARNALREARKLLGNLDALVDDDSATPAAEPDATASANSEKSPNLLRRLLGSHEADKPA